MVAPGTLSGGEEVGGGQAADVLQHEGEQGVGALPCRSVAVPIHHHQRFEKWVAATPSSIQVDVSWRGGLKQKKALQQVLVSALLLQPVGGGEG